MTEVKFLTHVLLQSKCGVEKLEYYWPYQNCFYQDEEGCLNEHNSEDSAKIKFKLRSEIIYINSSYGFIKHGHTKQDNIYFNISSVKWGNHQSLTVGDTVDCEVQFDPHRSSNFRATTVEFVYNCCSSEIANEFILNSVEKTVTNQMSGKVRWKEKVFVENRDVVAQFNTRIINGEGYITKIPLDNNGIIQHQNQSRKVEVQFSIDDYCSADKIMCLRDKVNFDAFLEETAEGASWRAVMVWKESPQITNAVDKIMKVERWLQTNHPFLFNEEN